jgi:hypothetical protein
MNFISLGFPVSHFILMLGFSFGILSSFFLFGVIGFGIFIFLIYFEVIRIVPLLKRINNSFTGFFPEITQYLEKVVSKSFIWSSGSEAGPKEPAIYLFHPHGAFSASFFFHTMTKVTNSSLKQCRPVVHRHLTWIPFAKEILEELGAVLNTYKEMKSVLEKGESLAVIPGGLAEMNCVNGGQMKLHLGHGIFKLSTEFGIPIIPILTFGENELYELVGSHPNSLLHSLQQFCYNTLGIMLPIPSWNSFKKWLQFIENGLSKSVISYMGQPILPIKGEKGEELRERYKKALGIFYSEKRPATYSKKIEFF